MEERLQKFMAECGVASRRKCEEIILQGKVQVNGEIINTLGTKINPEKDKVTYDGRILKKEEKKVYYILNKPEGVVTTSKDERGRKTVLDIVKSKERIFSIGRLDYDSSGLLLLTNDGDLYNRIIHPRENINKKYIAEVAGEFDFEDVEKFENGIDIGDYITAEAKARILSYNPRYKTTKIEVIIHEGKNRQIRRMCEELGHEVLTLKRTAVGKLRLGTLKKGEYRELNEEEKNYLLHL